MRIRIFLLLLLTGFFIGWVEPKESENPVFPGEAFPPYLYVQARWVDSTLQVMTPDERIGQLFMVAVFSRTDSDHAKVDELIKNYNIGGLIFMQGSPGRQASLTNYFQSITKVPLMIGQDAEWGLSMRLDSTIRYPHEIMLGAIQDDQLIYEFGREMARECKRIGVNVSFSPVVDVNSNPLNPVIGDRSFGEDKYNVASKGIMYMRGLQDGGVLACAKHFPGHGDTDQDSHQTLPTVNASRNRLDSLELYPFRKLIDAGVGSMMVAHLSIPSLDTTENLPSTLSKKIVTGLLKVDLGFKGLSFTDALNMKGVSKYINPGEVDLRALLAGNDVLLYSGNVQMAISQVKDAIKQGIIAQDEIDARVRKILQAKYWLGLSERKMVRLDSLYADLNSESAQLLKARLTENAITVVHNKNNFLPVGQIQNMRFASVAIGADSETPFQQMLGEYAGMEKFQIKKDASQKEFDNLEMQLRGYSAVFVAVQNMSRNPANGFGITQATKDFIRYITASPVKVVVAVFGSPYALKSFDETEWLIESYNDDSVTQQLTAQLIFGGISSKGKLPVTASGTVIRGNGIATAAAFRLKYTLPEDAGFDSKKLKAIDRLAYEAIDDRATPGCQVWVSKGGKVIWNKSYGNFTYDAGVNVSNENLYDLASVTKVAATTMMLMKLYEEQKLDLDKTIADYLPEFKGTDKQNIKIHQLLTHEAGFVPYFPFYKSTLDSSGNLKSTLYSRMNHAAFTVPVTSDIFMNRNYLDTIWSHILKVPLQSPGKYVYSDNDFYVLKKVAETIAGEPLDQFVEKNFYEPLGLYNMCFSPLSRFSKDKIVPSNYDFLFRKELLQGTVHDQGAAMQGGVAGHAGLFSNANDLGTLMAMLLNHGVYGGTRYLDSATIAKFTMRYDVSCRRGLGFDKPETEKGKASPASEGASSLAFGHQGFTGTCVWADPEYDLVYVFLSNRTFPDDENKKLNTLNTRIKIQQAIYDALLKTD